MYTPTNEYEEELEKMVQKWTDANTGNPDIKVPRTEII